MLPALPALPVLPALILALAGALGAGDATAQQVWRCGPEGRVFSDRPCADGRVMGSGDRPSADEVDAARQVAERERRLADTLASERAERARVAPGAGLMAIGPTEEELRAERRERELKRLQTSKRQAGKRRKARSDAGI